MKTTALRTWTAVCLLALTAAVAPGASAAEQSATEIKDQKSYTGTVVSVDPKERVLELKGMMRSRKFNLGDNCTYTIPDKKSGELADLRPGQKVMVCYQNAHGVLAASRVELQPMCYEGTVKFIDLQRRVLTLHRRGMDREFQLNETCMVTLHNNRSGNLADVKPGHYVTVTYEMPDGKHMARQIAQTSATFSGTLTAMDLNDRTVKVKATFGTRKFHLGDGCQVLKDKVVTDLHDLRLGNDVIISYDEVNGVSVANRIGVGEDTAGARTAQLTTPY